MKNTMSDEKLASKLSDDDKSTVTAKIDETTSWLDANQMAEKEEYEAKQKELEAVVNPILAALGGGAGAGGMPGGMPGGADAASVSELF
jgi:L1 cell adhesion molecule like protein